MLVRWVIYLMTWFSILCFFPVISLLFLMHLVCATSKRGKSETSSTSEVLWSTNEVPWSISGVRWSTSEVRMKYREVLVKYGEVRWSTREVRVKYALLKSRFFPPWRSLIRKSFKTLINISVLHYKKKQVSSKTL